MTVLEIINKRMDKYNELQLQLQLHPQSKVWRQRYNSAWWALQDLKEIIEQNNITEVK